MKIEIEDTLYDKLIELSHKINYDVDRTLFPYGLNVNEAELISHFITGLTGKPEPSIAF